MKAIQTSSLIWTKSNHVWSEDGCFVFPVSMSICSNLAANAGKTGVVVCLFLIPTFYRPPSGICLRKSSLLPARWLLLLLTSMSTIARLCQRYATRLLHVADTTADKKKTNTHKNEKERRHSRTKLETLSVKIIVNAQWYIFMQLKLFSATSTGTLFEHWLRSCVLLCVCRGNQCNINQL